jgi:uncharacterized membrane protein YgdD (TMEM256/DUF423 family)
MKPERIMGIAALLLAVGMGIGALGAHALQSLLSEHQLSSLDTGVDYQLFNSLGLLLIGAHARSANLRYLRSIAVVLIVGILCFSGGIYLMLAGAPRILGFVTPVGGVLLIGAWLAFALLLLRRH